MISTQPIYPGTYRVPILDIIERQSGLNIVDLTSRGQPSSGMWRTWNWISGKEGNESANNFEYFVNGDQIDFVWRDDPVDSLYEELYNQS